MLPIPSRLTASSTAPVEMPMVEFIALMAVFMALTALSIDVMLPALPAIGASLGFQNENQRQLIVIAYVVGFALGQPVFGPLSDRFGRKAPLLTGLGFYCAATVVALTASTMEMFLLARTMQGFAAAAPRVIAIAIVRDRFGGREMARVMSFVMMVFIVVPILAPAAGEAILDLAGWRQIFLLLLAAAAIVAIWTAIRLPETRQSADRRPLTATAMYGAARTIFSMRQASGYILALGFVFGILMSYIATAEQIFVDVYGAGSRFPFVFGAIAVFMVAASIVNASVVRRVGMRGVSHRALLGAVAVCGLAAAAGFPGHPPLLLFCTFMAVIFFCFGLIMPNFNALAMEPVGHIAGTASSLAGFYSTAAGAAFAFAIGQAFDGTVRPLCIGISVLATLALCTVLWVERFRLAGR